MIDFRPKALLFADAHLDLNTWANRPEIRGDSFHAFRWIISQAIHLEVTDVVGAGDLIDVSFPPSEVIGFLREQLDRLPENVDFWYVQGQHEVSGRPWIDSACPRAKHVHEQLFWIGETPCYGLDWTPPDQLQQRLALVPECKLLIAHQAWMELMGNMPSDGSWAGIPHAKTLFTGDFHKTVTLPLRPRSGADGQLNMVVSPGSTNLRAINEPQRKFCFLWDGVDQWQALWIPTRPIARMEAESADELNDQIDQLEDLLRPAFYESNELPEEIKTPLLHVKCPASDDNPVSRLRRAANHFGVHLFYRPTPPKAAAPRQESQREEAAVSMAGLLREELSEKNPLLGLALRLDGSRNVREELAALRVERGL